MKALEEEEVGSAGRRRVYGRLYWFAKESGLLGSKRRVVWPREVREAVRGTVTEEPGERPPGSYDDQYEDKPEVGLISISIVTCMTTIIMQPQSLKRQNGKTNA